MVNRRRLIGALALVSLVAAPQLPWRLANLAAHTLTMRQGNTRHPATHARYWQALDLVGKLDDLGYAVSFERDLKLFGTPIYGLTNKTKTTVTVEAALGWDARFDVLAHEGGHILQPVLTRDGGECFAESVAYLVTRDGVTEHARYMAFTKYACALTMFEYQREIYAAAALLEAR